MALNLEIRGLGLQHFETEPGELIGYVRLMPDGSTRLTWSLSVQGTTRRLPISLDDPDTYEFDPTVYYQSLSLPFRRLDDFDGRPIALDDPDTRWGDPNGTLYLFSHETVSRSTLHLARCASDRFRVLWGARRARYSTKRLRTR